MKHPADKATPELPGMPQVKKRGRPATGKAISSAERMKAYRERLKEKEPKIWAIEGCLKFYFERLEKHPEAAEYGQIKGAAGALAWIGLITDEQEERAIEWAYQAWKLNGYK